MARLLPILSALARVVWRDLRSLNSLVANNFFLFCFLMLGKSGVFIQVILGLLLLFPLSADPLRKIPADRLAAWPLSNRQHISLRVASMFLSPPVWITLALIVYTASPMLGLRFLALALAFGVVSVGAGMLTARAPQANLLRQVPALPGKLGGLVRKNIREMLSVLDPYAGLVLTISGAIYRMRTPNADPDALLMVTLLVMLSLSTYAQCLFAFDSESGFSRYRVLPLRGWEILAAKGAAFLLIAVLLSLPLAPLAGLGAALGALAVGHHSSVLNPAPQTRWRFTGAGSISLALIQVVAMFSAGALVYRTSALILLPCVGIYVLSLWYYGHRLEAAS